MGKQLRHKPLSEALLELKWKLKDQTEGAPGLDPQYPLYVGRLQEKIGDVYPSVETLPAAAIPDELTPHTVKYRFRRAPDGWPLVQAGPGIATLNFTQDYTWDSFLAAANGFYSSLLEAYRFGSIASGPLFTGIILRYINVVEVDAAGIDVLNFVSSYLHTSVALPDGIRDHEGLAGPPSGFHLQVTYPLKDANGVATMRIGTGMKESKPAIVWEQVIQSSGKSVPQEASDFDKWLDRAHQIAEDWFFSLIKGPLEERFAREKND